jgi:hypothetical protein
MYTKNVCVKLQRAPCNVIFVCSTGFYSLSQSCVCVSLAPFLVVAPVKFVEQRELTWLRGAKRIRWGLANVIGRPRQRRIRKELQVNGSNRRRCESNYLLLTFESH